MYRLTYTVDQNANYEGKKVHLDNLYRMVQFCENRTDCRRSQQMTYFGEIFDRKHCANMKQAICDNCSSKVGVFHISTVNYKIKLLLFEYFVNLIIVKACPCTLYLILDRLII